MIRGWRLNPAWVAHYKARDEEHAKHAGARLEYEIKAMRDNMWRLKDELSARLELDAQS